MTVLVRTSHWELPKFTVRSHSAGKQQIIGQPRSGQLASQGIVEGSFRTAEAAGQAAHRMMALSATRLLALGAWLERAEDAHDVRGQLDPTFQFDPTLLVRRTMR